MLDRVIILRVLIMLVVVGTCKVDAGNLAMLVVQGAVTHIVQAYIVIILVVVHVPVIILNHVIIITH
jgi:hypothetical protein